MSSDSRDSEAPRPGEPSRDRDASQRDRSSKPGGKEANVAALIRSIEVGAKERERALEQRRQRRRSPIWYVLVLLGLFGNAYLWIGQPEWLGLGARSAPTIEEEEGMLRYRMYVQARRLEAFRNEHGTLPETLEESGPPMEGLRYRQTGQGAWELLGESGRARLVLHSAQRLDEFLGVAGGGGSDASGNARGDGS